MQVKQDSSEPILLAKLSVLIKKNVNPHTAHLDPQDES